MAVFLPWQSRHNATKLSTLLEPPCSRRTMWSTSYHAGNWRSQCPHFHDCCAATNFFLVSLTLLLVALLRPDDMRRASICASLLPDCAKFDSIIPSWNNDFLFAKSRKGDSMSADDRLIGMYRMMSLACASMLCDCPGFLFRKM